MRACRYLPPSEYRSVDDQLETFVADVLNLPPVNSTMYRGYSEAGIFGLLYLLRRNPEECILLSNFEVMIKRLSEPVLNLDTISLVDWGDIGFVWDGQILSFPGNVSPEVYSQMVNNCFVKKPNSRFSVCIMTLYGEKIRHANIILYDRETREAERFDPYQAVLPDMNLDGLDNKLAELFLVIGGGKGAYHPPADLSFFEEGIQTSQEKENEMKRKDPFGFCQPWTFLVADTRLAFPDQTTISITASFRRAVKNKNRSLTKFIRNYSNHLLETSRTIYSRFHESKQAFKRFDDVRVPFTLLMLRQLRIYQQVFI